MPYIGRSTDGFGVRNRFLYLASASDTSVSGADANGATLTFTDGAYVDVYLNGVLLKAGTDYNTNTANTIAGISSMSANDEVTVIVYDVFTVGDMVSATSGGTFTGNVNFSGNIDVDGTANLDVVDIDGNVDIAGTSTLNDDVTFTGANYNVVWDKSDNALEFPANAKAKFGSDLEIFSNGGNGVIKDVGSGNLQLVGNVVQIRNSGNTENMIKATQDGAVELYYDNSKKLETSSNGVTIHNGATGQQPLLLLKDMNSGVVSGDEGGGLYWYTNDSNGTGNNLAIIQKFENSSGGAGLAFETGTGSSRSERMRINTDGRVRIGSGSAESGVQLEVNAPSTIPISMRTDGGNGNNRRCNLNAYASGNGTYGGGFILETRNNSNVFSEAMRVDYSGAMFLQNVYDDTTSFSANMYIHSDGVHQVLRSTSSERYKKNIETLEDKYADAVLGLRPVWYKSKCEADNPDYSHWGLIAEEVAKVDPRLVTFRKEITKRYRDLKTEKEVVETTKLDEPQAESVQYERFIPHLINICKRQEDKITALEAKVKALEKA